MFADESLTRLLREVAASASGLELLVLHGSRARGDATASSDWDFGALGGFDPARLAARLGEAVGSDRVDVADLARAGALLRYRAARDGVVIFELRAGAYDRFWKEAVGFYCDAKVPLSRAWEGVLEGLGR